MEWIIEENCYNLESIEVIIPYFKPFLDFVLHKLNITSLDYFVIADSREDIYAETVNKYASLVGTETYITQDGVYYTAGKSLDGLDKDGKYHQAIVIKSSVFVCAAYEYMGAQGLLNPEFIAQMETPPFMSMLLIIHELGHAIDNERQYEISGTVNRRVLFDLDYEYDEYVKLNALSLWGEYYAESFAHNIIRSIVGETTSKESELEECIRTYSFGTDRHSLLERVYRLLYYFMFQLSYVHQSNNFSKVFDYSKYEEDAFLSLYVPILANVEVAILKLNRRYPYWDSYEELNELSAIFKEFVIFEKKIQHKTLCESTS